jgi:hypothetical protein
MGSNGAAEAASYQSNEFFRSLDAAPLQSDPN